MIFSLYFQCPTIDQKKGRRSYDTVLIAKAYADVKERGMSVYRAAKEYCIPESTRNDRHLRIQLVDNLPSQRTAPLLSREEEESLVDLIDYMCHISYVYSRQAFLDTAFDYAVILNKKSPDNPHFKLFWYHGFVKR